MQAINYHWKMVLTSGIQIPPTKTPQVLQGKCTLVASLIFSILDYVYFQFKNKFLSNYRLTYFIFYPRLLLSFSYRNSQPLLVINQTQSTWTCEGQPWGLRNLIVRRIFVSAFTLLGQAISCHSISFKMSRFSCPARREITKHAASLFSCVVCLFNRLSCLDECP